MSRPNHHLQSQKRLRCLIPAIDTINFVLLKCRHTLKHLRSNSPYRLLTVSMATRGMVTWTPVQQLMLTPTTTCLTKSHEKRHLLQEKKASCTTCNNPLTLDSKTKVKKHDSMRYTHIEQMWHTACMGKWLTKSSSKAAHKKKISNVHVAANKLEKYDSLEVNGKTLIWGTLYRWFQIITVPLPSVYLNIFIYNGKLPHTLQSK